MPPMKTLFHKVPFMRPGVRTWTSVHAGLLFHLLDIEMRGPASPGTLFWPRETDPKRRRQAQVEMLWEGLMRFVREAGGRGLYSGVVGEGP